MSKKVFISYSRKDTLAIAEFKTIKKFRDFEIVIDDEEIPFNQLWKDNIRKKINDSDAAIFFISKNALKKDSPIRSLEIPLISKRLRDPKDDFNFFPIFLEDVGKKLDSYTFTTLKDSKEVKFLDFFQIYEIEKQNTLENLSMLKRKRFFKNINANISQVLKGGTLSPGQDLITKLSRIQKVRWAIGILSLVVGLSWFTTTDAYARILIAAYEQRIESGEINAESAAVKFLADQLNTVENLDSLTSDEVLLKSVGEIADLSTNIVEDTETQNIELSSTQDSTTIGSTTTTIGSTTTTTIGSTTTTIGSTTTTIGSTTTTIGSTTTTTIDDTIAPTFTKTLTAANVTSGKVDISWEASDNIQISYYVLREGSYIIYQGTNNFKEVEGLTSNKSYTFSVDAYDKAGNFSTSEVTFITLDTTTTTTIPTTTTTLYQNKLPAITALDFGWNSNGEYTIMNDGTYLGVYPRYTIKSMDLTVLEYPTIKFIVNEDTNHILDCNRNPNAGYHSTTSKNFEGLQNCRLDISNYNYADTLKLYEISLKTSLGEESVVYRFDLSVENNDFSDSLNYTNYLQATSHNYFVSLEPINLGEYSSCSWSDCSPSTGITPPIQNKLPAITALDFGWSSFPEYQFYNNGNNLAVYPRYTIKSMDLTVLEYPTIKFIVNEDTNHILDCNPNQFRGFHTTTTKNFEGLQECSLDISNFSSSDTLKLYEISLKTSLGEESVVYKFDLSVENNDFSDSLNYTNYLQATSHNYFVSLEPINLGE